MEGSSNDLDENILSKSPYITHVIFSSGGLMGLCYLGILRYLYIENITKNIKYIAGTSIGAYFGLILALKIPIEYIEEELYKIITELNEKQDMVITKNNIFQLFQSNGIYDIRFLMSPIVKYIKTEYDVTDLTYIELTKKNGVNLYVSCTCLNTSSNKIFSIENTPNVSVLESVLASMSIPFFIHPVCIDGEYYIDGIMSKSPQVDNFFLDVNEYNILSFLLYSTCKEDIQVYERDTRFNFVTYTIRMLQIMLSTLIAHTTDNMENPKYNNVMKIKNLPYSKVVKFRIKNDEILIDVTHEDMENMILKGFVDVTNYMNKRYNN